MSDVLRKRFAECGIVIQLDHPIEAEHVKQLQARISDNPKARRFYAYLQRNQLASDEQREKSREKRMERRARLAYAPKTETDPERVERAWAQCERDYEQRNGRALWR